MILGLGSDITDVRRVAKVIERHGDRFLARVFTEVERARAERKKNRVETYAKRFAEKMKKPPTPQQINVYMAVTHYLNAVKAANSTDSDAVMAKVKSLMP